MLEQTRDQTRANTVTAWGQLVAGKAQVESAQAQVTASEIALNGVRDEAKAGQRTTLDVPASTYDPSVHYQQVRDAWFGVRTPDGR